MANDVFANGREISCKAADGKSIAAFPDVCLSPPTPPAGPVPLPYPNTAYASDTAGGSKRVRISGKEVMLRDSSYFKKSTGDEAATQGLPKGFVTHALQGKAYFNSWSMDVKIEGQNAVRHLDLTTHNHMSKPGQTPPWAHIDTGTFAKSNACKKDREQVKRACNPEKNWRRNCPKKPKTHAQFDAYAKKCEANDCLRARKCMLVPYTPKSGCCPGQTGDHLIDAASFLEPDSSISDRNARIRITGWKKYNVNKAPVVCAEGPNQTTATHGQLHTRKGVAALHFRDSKGMWSLRRATQVGAKAHSKVFKSSGCSQQCIEQQLKRGHEGFATTKPPSQLKASSSMTSDAEARDTARKEMGIPAPRRIR
jgi:hypothetical protein